MVKMEGREQGRPLIYLPLSLIRNKLHMIHPLSFIFQFFLSYIGSFSLNLQCSTHFGEYKTKTSWELANI